MKRLTIVMLLFVTAGCHFAPEEVPDDFTRYPFDKQVIEKIPVYDSLANAILENYPYFQKHMNLNESYHAYKYRPGSDQADVYSHLPPEITAGIDDYFSKLGKEFIHGFDVFEDSTIKLYVRNSLSELGQGTIEENLSFYPLQSQMRRRELPVKDTILDEHWQYWIRFNKRRLF